MSSATEKSQAAYGEGNTIAQQALSSIRTVYSFNAEALTKRAFEATLGVPEAQGIKQSIVIGAVMGSFQLVMFGAYGITLWYASGRIRAGSYDGGTVMTVFFSSLIGGFAIGQAGPSFSAFSTGRAAGHRMFSVIDRKPVINARAGGKKLQVKLKQIPPRQTPLSVV